MTGIEWRPWVVDIIAGGVVGGIVGAIVAWNIAIYWGVPSGYEAGIGEIFAHSVLAGALWLAALVSGPVLGIVVARNQRHKRELRDRHRVGIR
ncbi:MAG TPA: hypothetical protein VF148_12780 [Acidimicrobiia bacterium]